MNCSTTLLSSFYPARMVLFNDDEQIAMQRFSDGGSDQVNSGRMLYAFLLLLTIAVFLLFKTSPRAGDFWWSDAPRHAMDGVFYYDMSS